MDRNAVWRLLRDPWEPLSYNLEELVRLLKITRPQADRIIKDVNAGHLGEVLFVTHHDLMAYLKDVSSVASIPENEEEISSHGRWLISSGWRLDPRRSKYRWIDPRDHDIRCTLSAALFREMNLQRSRQPMASPRSRRENVMDAEFEVRQSTRPSEHR